MDLFKQKSMKMATSFDWNCKCCKRWKSKTKRILGKKEARRKGRKEWRLAQYIRLLIQ